MQNTDYIEVLLFNFVENNMLGNLYSERFCSKFFVSLT